MTYYHVPISASCIYRVALFITRTMGFLRKLCYLYRNYGLLFSSGRLIDHVLQAWLGSLMENMTYVQQFLWQAIFKKNLKTIH